LSEEGRSLSEQIVPTLWGVHLLLQPLAKVLNHGLEGTFWRWYPRFRTQASSYDWKWRVPGRFTSLAPPLIHNQAEVRSETSRTLTKFNINIKRLHNIRGFHDFHEIYNALMPLIPSIFDRFEMAPCVHS
jgi:hypothetical protein